MKLSLLRLSKKMKLSLLRLSISIAGFILNLYRHYLEKKTILSLSILITVVCVPVLVVPIVKSVMPKDFPTPVSVPTPVSESDVNSGAQVKNPNEPTFEEPKDIQKPVESETQSMQNVPISEELKDIRRGVRSGTQSMEGMRQKVKVMNEDTQKMIEKVKKMNEKVNEQPEN